MVLAIIADALQIVLFSRCSWKVFLLPAADVLDFGVAALLIHLLGWHWEFLPSFLAKFVPGVDLVPFWTMAYGIRLKVQASRGSRKQLARSASRSKDDDEGGPRLSRDPASVCGNPVCKTPKSQLLKMLSCVINAGR